RASRYYGDAAEADDIRREVGGPLRQAGFRLPADRGCLPLPGGREVDLSLYARGGWQDTPPLSDDGMPTLPAQGAMHTGSAATHHALGARTCARSCAAASRCKPAGDARAPRDRRASFRHAQDVDGSNPLSDEATAEGCDRDGLARARLQSHARHEYHWGKASPRGNPRMRAALLRQNLDSADYPQRSGDMLSSVRSIGVSRFLPYLPPTKLFRTARVMSVDRGLSIQSPVSTGLRTFSGIAANRRSGPIS